MCLGIRQNKKIRIIVALLLYNKCTKILVEEGNATEQIKSQVNT